MYVFDLVSVVDGGLCAIITLWHGAFGYGVSNLVAVGVKPGQALPDVGPGIAVLTLGDGGVGDGGAARRAVEGQSKRLGTDAVLVAVVIPDLIDVNVDELISVGLGNGVDRVGGIDRTG